MPRGVARRNRLWNAGARRAHIDLDTSGYVGSYNAIAGDAAFATGDAIKVRNTGLGAFASLGVASNQAWCVPTLALDPSGAFWTVTLTVDASAQSAGTKTATLTFTDANADNTGATRGVTFVVAAGTPSIAISPSSTFSITLQDETVGTAQTRTISNAGRGTMATPSVGTVTGTGAAYVGTPAITGSGPWTLTVTPNATGGTPGTYTASIPIISSGASNSPQTVTANVTVTAAPLALLSLTRTIDDAAIQVGDPNPPSEVTGIQSANGQPLAGPTIQSTSYSGTHTGWASASLVGQTLTVSYNVSGISTSGASYFYVVIADANASNTVTYQVYLKVGAAAAIPAFNVMPSSVARTVYVGNSPSAASIMVTNGAGTLAELGTLGLSFTTSQTWVTATLNANTGQIDLSFTTGALPAATYSANLRLTGTLASNSPVDIPIQVQVLPVIAGAKPIPLLAAPPAGYTWDATKGYPTGSVFNQLASFRGCDNGAMPSFTGTEYVCTSDANFTAALAAAVDGDIITLQAGTVFNRVQLPKRAGWTEGTSGFVWIRSSAHASLPAYAYANGPTSYAQANCVDATTHAAYLATIQVTLTNLSPICPQQGAGGYWFTGINFKANTTAPTGFNVALTAHVGFLPNNSGVSYQQTLADVPSCFVFDRCAFTAGPNGTQNSMILDGRYVRVVHCDLGYARFYSPSPVQRPECHSFVTYNTDGRIEIIGNKFAANGIGWLIGGAPPAINDVVPYHLAMMWNRIWWPAGLGTEYDSQAIKNAGEFKTGRFGIFAFNDIRRMYLNPNQRFAFLVKPTDQPVGYSAADPNGHPTGYPAHVTDIAIWCNRIVQSAKGLFGIADTEAHPAGEPGGEIGAEFIEVGYNLHQWDPAYYSTYYGVPTLAKKRPLYFDKGGGNGVNTLLIHHNTMGGLHDFAIGQDSTSLGGGWVNLQVINNVHTDPPTYGPLFFSGNANSAGLDQRIGPGNWTWRRNFTRSGGATWDATLRNAQNANGYLTAADFVDPASFNFTLNPTTSASASFPSGGGGTDGKDCGYDHAYLTTMLADLGG